MGKANINTMVAPYLLDPGDPFYHEQDVNKGNSIKYLTIKNSRRIMKRVINRKDDRMAIDKKYKLKITQYAAIAVLTLAAINGITEFLGGGLRDALAAAFLAGLLCAFAVGE